MYRLKYRIKAMWTQTLLSMVASGFIPDCSRNRLMKAGSSAWTASIRCRFFKEQLHQDVIKKRMKNDIFRENKTTGCIFLLAISILEERRRNSSPESATISPISRASPMIIFEFIKTSDFRSLLLWVGVLQVILFKRLWFSSLFGLIGGRWIYATPRITEAIAWTVILNWL